MPISVDVDGLTDEELRECLDEARRRGMTVGDSLQEGYRRNVELAYQQLAEGRAETGLTLLRHLLYTGGIVPAQKVAA